MPGTTVELNDLADHDLLLMAVEQTKCLPELTRRVTTVESKLAVLEVKGGIVAVIATAVATFLGIAVKP